MKKNILHIMLFIIFTVTSYGQILVSDSITLTNPNGNNRQIYNLGTPLEKSAAVNANVYLQNKLLMGTITNNTDTISLTFPIKFTKYYTGMVIYFVSQNENTSALFVNADSLGPKEIKVFGRGLKKGEVASNRIIKLLYNGNNFDMQSEPSAPCPAGFAPVNKKYCIEVDERDSLNYYDATAVCGDNNARLCTWSEWKYACDNASVLNNIIGNYEWINDAENYTNGMIGAKVSGGISCDDNTSQNTTVTNIRKYRCCYSR